MERLRRFVLHSETTPWRHEAAEQRDELIEEKSQEQSVEARYQALQSKYRTLKRWVLVLGLLVGCFTIVLLFPWHKEPVLREGRAAAVPDIPSSKVTFERHERFAAAPSPESDGAWGSMMPPGDGFVIIDDPRRYSLPPGKSSKKGGEVYDISMFHQLHCLAHVRNFMGTMQASLNRTNGRQVFDVLLAPQQDHVWHCFDYIRQAIMCAGDLTLEWPRTEPDGRRFAVDGWGVEHECRSWDAIMDFVEAQTVTRHQ